MTITEKVSYLRGLLEGLDVNKDTKEGKIFLAIADVLDDMALTVADLEDETAALSEQIDLIDEDLSMLEDDVYEDDDEDEDDDDFEDELFEVTCPNCGDTIYVDEGMLEEGSIRCPNCNELLEFDIDEEGGCDGDCANCPSFGKDE